MLMDLQAGLVFVALFSLPTLLLELQFLFIGFSFMSASVLIATAIIGALCAGGAVLIEVLDI